MSRRTLAILTAYDPALPGTRTFYLTSGTAFLTGPSETPASQAFDPTLAQGLPIARRLQGVGGGAVRPAMGVLEVANGDGAYDAWAGYAWDGRAVVLREGPEAGAYPTDYPVVFTGTIDRVDVDTTRIQIRVRDAVAALDVPLQTDRFLGNNVAPSGLEGDSALAGVIKPLAFGRVKNVPLVEVNAAKRIHLLHDAAVQTLDDVYDGPVRLGAFAPFGWSETQGTYGGRALATDGTTLVMGNTSTAVGGTPTIYTTTDGTTFSVIGSLPFAAGSGFVVGLAFAPTLGTQGRFVAVTNRGTGGQIAYSDDAGATWTLATNPTTAIYTRVRWDARRGYFIAVGTGGAIHVSATGTGTWTNRSVGGVTDTLNDVAVDGPTVLAVGAAGRVVRSTSATLATWTASTYGTIALLAACWADGTYYVSLDVSGTILRSADTNEFVRVVVHNEEETFRVQDFAAADGWVVALLQTGNVNACVSASRDGGLTWTATGITPRPSGLVCTAICPFAERFYFADSANLATYASAVTSTYASLADLEDDTLAPEPGTYKWISTASGSYVRLGASPVNAVTADFTCGATDADRTAGQLFVDVLERAGYTAGAWSATDITALDAAENGVCGLFVDDETTVADALDRLARTAGAWWGVDAAGVFRVQQLTAPSGASTFSITADDIVLRSLERVASDDPLLGRPSTRTTLRYALRDTLALDGVATAVDAGVLTTNPLAQSTEEETLFTQPADAAGEATRRQTLRGVPRVAYRVTVRLSDYRGVDLGAVGTLAHPRFGLGGGVLVRVVGVEPDPARRMVTLTLWR